MPPLRLALFASMASTLALAATPLSALACSCVSSTLEQALEGSSAVFEGLVTQDSLVSDENGEPRERVVTLRIVRTWKGLEDVEQVEVHTGPDGARCGVEFVEGEGYLVFAAGREEGDDTLWASACGRTRPIADADEDLGVLGAGVTPVSVSPASNVPAEGADPAPSQEVPASRGGCASCAAGPSAPLPPAGALAPLLWVAWARRRRHA